MPIAFIIMQIGNSDLDLVCKEVIVPALRNCGLDPKRVDKHNQGRLLKSEIIAFIDSSEIIVADLTNERPNCYLEVGYAMGVDKFQNLILTAREDHNPDHPEHKRGGPKVHFDLSGYDVLFWSPKNLDAFRSELEKRISRRQAVISSEVSSETAASLDSDWFQERKADALRGFASFGTKGFMEVKFSLTTVKPDFPQRKLLDAAGKSVIRTFGWPMGAVLPKPEYRPHPTAEGIVAEIMEKKKGQSFDYWSLRRNGDFYLLRDLFEDMKRPEQDALFINTRIAQTTEALLYCARLNSEFGIDSSEGVRISIRHGGLKGRKLAWITYYGLDFEDDCESSENESAVEFTCPLSRIESGLTELVKSVCEPLFTLFNFFQVPDELYAEKVETFVKGRAT